MAQWIERWTSNPKVAGSSPVGGTYCCLKISGFPADSVFLRHIDVALYKAKSPPVGLEPTTTGLKGPRSTD